MVELRTVQPPRGTPGFATEHEEEDVGATVWIHSVCAGHAHEPCSGRPDRGSIARRERVAGPMSPSSVSLWLRAASPRYVAVFGTTAAAGSTTTCAFAFHICWNASTDRRNTSTSPRPLARRRMLRFLPGVVAPVYSNTSVVLASALPLRSPEKLLVRRQPALNRCWRSAAGVGPSTVMPTPFAAADAPVSADLPSAPQLPWAPSTVCSANDT
mmetsp:Transcript_135408/g.329149  ORF Transcript_135408/g.329149 Transcript_135408/m.329149 type:complete len:213 (-) Transcript_135408:166-804(-)